jgi:hypothetical protein
MESFFLNEKQNESGHSHLLFYVVLEVLAKGIK